MHYQFRLQDPSNPRGHHVIDDLTRLITTHEVTELTGMFAFVTGAGLKALYANAQVKHVFSIARVYFLVGNDAVTDRSALEFLLQLDRENRNFTARVLENPTGALVHPKWVHVTYRSGAGALLVGSANLTLGGLGGNVEAYSILTYDRGEQPDLHDGETFLRRWSPYIVPIGESSLAKADRNQFGYRGGGQRTTETPDQEIVVEGVQIRQPSPSRLPAAEPMLVAQIPGAGKRWSQVHFNREVMEKFFNLDPEDHEILYLRELNAVSYEERPIVFAERNRNVKVEIGSAKGLPYPGLARGVQQRPILLVRREGTARYRYLLLMPGEPGHAEMLALSVQHFQPHGTQLPRIVVSRNQVVSSWRDCPL